MKIANKKILVTGAGGFIGSHLVEELLKTSAKVKAFIHYNSRNHYGNLEQLAHTHQDIEFVTGDIRDYQTVFKAVQDTSVVFHLAALIGIPYSYQSPDDVFATNVNGTLNVLNAARACGTEKVVITSTSEVYGTPLYVPIDEKHPLQAQSPYAASKIAADKLAESFFYSFDLPVSTVRPFNTFGPRQSARAVIPTIITQALSGKEIKLGNLNSRRDLLFVKDTVNGFIKAAEFDSSIGTVHNIGTGGDLSIGDLAEMILQITKSDAVVVQDEKRVRPQRSEVQRLICNYDKAKDNLGWQPDHSIEDGLIRTINYIKANLSEYKTDIYNV